MAYGNNHIVRNPVKDLKRYKEARIYRNSNKWKELIEFKREIREESEKKLSDLKKDLLQEIEDSELIIVEELEIYLALIISELEKR